MSCERYMDLISARLDGVLTQTEEDELMQHLKCCDQCRAIARDLEEMSVAFAGAQAVQPPEELSRGVMERIHAQRAGQRRNVVRRVGGLAAALVLCAGLYPMLRAMAPAGKSGMAMEAADTSAPMQPARYTEQEPAADGALMDTVGGAGKTTGATQNGQAASRNAEEYKYYSATRAKKKLRVSDTDSDGMSKPEAWVLDSVQTLEEFLTRFAQEDLAEAVKEYDADFFRTGRLLAVVVQEPSSSITHEVTGLDEARVSIKRHVPEAGDCDMARWIILVEGDGFFGPARALDVELTEE